MKRVLISGFAAIVLFAAATTMLRSHSAPTDRHVAAVDVTSLHTATANRVPIEDFEDMSLVYSSAPKH